MDKISQMAKDLGQVLGRTDEYRALRKAVDTVEGDRELVKLRNRLQSVEERIESTLRSGTQPDDELREEYEGTVEELQAKPGYQRLVAAQANFDKVIQRVNRTIAEGIQEGGQSRIVIPD